MAPEQARGRGNLVDARTDIWAVGALVFFLLTGRTVHEAETANELLIASATQPAHPMREFCADLPESVAAIVDRALEMDRERRWPDARSMKDALASARSEIPEPVLDRSVDRVTGIGGTATVPETHTAEPSVVSRKDRGRTPATPTTSVSRSAAVPWAIATAVLVTAIAATLVVGRFDESSRSPEASPAARTAAATNATTPAPLAPPEIQAAPPDPPPAPARFEPKEPLRTPDPVTDERPRKKPSNVAVVPPEPPARVVEKSRTSTPAPSAAVDILDVRR
jgi:serine/threonine-protein kinase